MGSLNGDITVMRNGRTTSQVSVYNYPEHLNPFYEDDQHKRLRFWKINKKDNDGRRNSFSIGNLKDMWAFKSFRMKKKSSTLGINKTSESPPLLRRDYVLDNGWNTFDHRLRASNTSSINGDSFQRNATYRSSLQTLPTNSDRIGLNRNDGYRSTIQMPRSNSRFQQLQEKQHQHQPQSMGNRRYVYGGSVTPQPFRNSRTYTDSGPNKYDSGNGMIRRSSQSSMVSTNPFESDEDDENYNSTGIRSVGSTTTLTSRTPRKKRPAPAPPTPMQVHVTSTPLPTIRIETSHDNNQDELRIKEDIDIANLTAEIESFVKTKSNDDVEATQKDDVQITITSALTNSSDNNESVTLRRAVGETQGLNAGPKEISNTVITTEYSETLPKQTTNVAQKSNDQVTTKIVTVSATTKTTADVIKPLEKVVKTSKVTNEIKSHIDESQHIKTNGAIPKKPNNSSLERLTYEQDLQEQLSPTVADLCIKETHAEQLSQKPVPLQRQIKTEAEVGHIECIHVHVESPKATQRHDHTNGLSTFKTSETLESSDIITTKTPFVLTSPPTPRKTRPQVENAKPVKKEIVKIVETNPVNERVNELNIKEEPYNVKPKISVKPTLSPKPVTKEANGKMHGFAEIHKPARRSIQNGHVRKGSRDGSITPPSVPLSKINELEQKINNTPNLQIKVNKCEKKESIEPIQHEAVNNLKIIENTTSFNTNGHIKPIEDESVTEIKEKLVTSNNSSVSNLANHKELQKREEEYDFLYRPKPATQLEWKRSTLAPLETNIPPEKRKSVKDIIESINRSQRLLNAAANKDFTVLQNQNPTSHNPDNPEAKKTHPSVAVQHNSNNNFNQNHTITKESHNEIQSAYVDDLAGAASSPSPSPSNYNNECTEAQELDNNEIFQKCKVKKEVYDYRETSPITSNLDWNPVPKPKRTKASNE